MLDKDISVLFVGGLGGQVGGFMDGQVAGFMGGQVGGFMGGRDWGEGECFYVGVGDGFCLKTCRKIRHFNSIDTGMALLFTL